MKTKLLIPTILFGANIFFSACTDQTKKELSDSFSTEKNDDKQIFDTLSHCNITIHYDSITQTTRRVSEPVPFKIITAKGWDGYIDLSFDIEEEKPLIVRSIELGEKNHLFIIKDQNFSQDNQKYSAVFQTCAEHIWFNELNFPKELILWTIVRKKWANTIVLEIKLTSSDHAIDDKVPQLRILSQQEEEKIGNLLDWEYTSIQIIE